MEQSEPGKKTTFLQRYLAACRHRGSPMTRRHFARIECCQGDNSSCHQHRTNFVGENRTIFVGTIGQISLEITKKTRPLPQIDGE